MSGPIVWFRVNKEGLYPTKLKGVTINDVDDLRTEIKNKTPEDISCSAPALRLEVLRPYNGEMIELNQKLLKLYDGDIKDFVEEFKISEDNPIKVCLPVSQDPSQFFDDSVDWQNPESILKKMQELSCPFDTTKPKLLSTYGAKFILCQRESTIDTLWNGTEDRNGVLKRFEKRRQTDRNEHPIPFLAGGPGTGKSRFLMEAKRLLEQKLKTCENQEMQTAFENVLAINVTFGNGTPALQADVEQPEASVALRVLFEYFASGGPISFGTFRSKCGKEKGLTLNVALQVIRLHFGTSPLTIMLGIDELNILYELDSSAVRPIMHAVGGIGCAYDDGYFVIPILAGTIQGPLQKIVRESMYRLLLLPLPLLTEDDMMYIGKNLNPQQYIKDYITSNKIFRCCLCDIGGQVRALEIFYKKIIGRLETTNTSNLDDIDLVEILKDVETELRNLYKFNEFVEDAMPALAKAILNIPVEEDEKITLNGNAVTYLELSSYGILHLVDAHDHQVNVRLPYLWVQILVHTSIISGLLPHQFWQEMVPNRPIFWQEFELFNMRFWALRLSLLSFLGKTTIPLKDLLCGAWYSDIIPDVTVKIPRHNSINVRRLVKRFPDHLEIRDVENRPHSDIHTQFDTFYVNGEGAETDGFHFMNLDKAGSDNESIFVIFQCKLSNDDTAAPQAIDILMLKEESDKAKAANSKLLQAVENCPVKEWILVVLSNGQRARSLRKYRVPEKCALVDSSDFLSYFGHSFAYRAQFAANEKICVNSAQIWELKSIAHVSSQMTDTIVGERKKKIFESLDDFELRTKFPRNMLHKVKI